MSRTDEATTTDAAWAERYSLLSECLKPPTERFTEQVADGSLEAELRARGMIDEDETPRYPSDVTSLRGQYQRLFEGVVSPYARPVESVYKPWYGNRDGGLLGGPPAADMKCRFAAFGVEPPEAYPVDHVALELEYASHLIEGTVSASHEEFVADHLDWIPAFRRVTDEATAEAPFYRWIVSITADVVAADRRRLEVEGPNEETIEAMVERARP